MIIKNKEKFGFEDGCLFIAVFKSIPRFSMFSETYYGAAAVHLKPFISTKIIYYH